MRGGLRTCGCDDSSATDVPRILNPRDPPPPYPLTYSSCKIFQASNLPLGDPPNSISQDADPPSESSSAKVSEASSDELGICNKRSLLEPKKGVDIFSSDRDLRMFRNTSDVRCCFPKEEKIETSSNELAVRILTSLFKNWDIFRKAVEASRY